MRRLDTRSKQRRTELIPEPASADHDVVVIQAEIVENEEFSGMSSDRPTFYITTAIDYPNSRPHIGTAFEKIGADAQARFRRMNGYDVHFLMGNDENTIKVEQRASELGLEPKPYVDGMAEQFREVWAAHGRFENTARESSRRNSYA
jgi:leucyl-tRNA synthetase